MSTVTKPRSRVKPRRNERYAEVTPAGEGAWLVTMTIGSDVVAYRLARVPSDFGDGYHVAKVGSPESDYHVHLSDAGSTCECWGWMRWGHCRHVECLAALQDAGRLCPCRNHAEVEGVVHF